MPLMDHLRELRNRLVKALLFVALGTVVGYFLYEPVWDLLRGPYCSLPAEARGGRSGCDLIFTGVFDAFFVAFRVWIIVGVLVSSPFWLYQLWAFVAPALTGREKRYTYGFVPTAALLFVGGAALAYYVTGLAMAVLFEFAPEGSLPMITIDSYLGYMTLMMLVFGLGFVTPLLVALLNLIGVIRHETLAKSRRLIIFGIFVLAAIVTPAEPLSMLALALPLVVLYEAAELFCFINDRRRGRRDEFAGLSDDEISPLDDEESLTDSGPSR
ncbi:twin-arginine translocase subunit TatC [Streptomonospora sp. S1-112]|uniref:Sec-independent protein translocase protein TatC n=1 Tax=Streptomonospora mangrovi TaxID=2883123 RepID=A0A9X3NMP1_9ACTN|nr:twin-arginine translocase subunit TatC [Streptomonospora mangrovi]MDA0564594.1 twin-arginine translocase subunit TatC [Streptomonospora mangrovi]